MSLTAESIGILVSKRLGLPPSARLSVQTQIDAGLEKLARQVANDATKRHLLQTVKGSVTASVTNTTYDYYADLSTIQSTNAVMLDYLEYGTIYFVYPSKTYSGMTAATDTITSTSHGLPTGLKVQLTTTGTLGGGLAVSTDYYIISTGTSSLQLATSKNNAFAGTAIDLTATEPEGTNTIVPWEQETLQWTNREFGELNKSVPINYIYGWRVDTKLFTNATAGTFGFAVSFIPTLTTLPTKLEQDLLDIIVDMAASRAGETGGDSK